KGRCGPNITGVFSCLRPSCDCVACVSATATNVTKVGVGVLNCGVCPSECDERYKPPFLAQRILRGLVLQMNCVVFVELKNNKRRKIPYLACFKRRASSTSCRSSSVNPPHTP